MPASSSSGRLGGVRDDADHPLGAGPGRGRDAQRPGLAGPADDRDDGLFVAGDHAVGQRGGAADVHHRQREGRVEVVGDHRRDRPAEQDGVPVAGDLLGGAVPARQGVLDDERGEGQRDERGDPVPHGQAERGLGADLLDGADQHAAGAGLGVLHLAPGLDDREHLGPDRGPVVAVLALELAERRGVEVEPFHADPDLVGPEVATGVEPLRRLRQHGALVQDPVQAGRIADRRTFAGRRHRLSSHGSRSETGNCPAWHWTCRRLSAYSGMSSAPATTDAPTDDPGADRHEHRDGHRPRDGPALPLPTRRAGRARLDALPGVARRHRRRVGVGAVAARALREERQAAARAARRPRRRPLLRRPRARPGRAGHHVDAGAAADDEHDGADLRRPPGPGR